MSSIIVRADRASEPSVVGRKSADRSTSKVYLDRSGIASLTAAAFMLRDCDVPGNNITGDTLTGLLATTATATSSSSAPTPSRKARSPPRRIAR